jgi:HK97 family phage portal protein
MASWWRNLLGVFVRGAPVVPAGMEMRDGLPFSMSIGSTAPKRGTRELLAAFREQPRLRAVVSRIARGVASAQAHVYVRVQDESTERSTFTKRRDLQGEYRDIALVPSFRWGADRGVRDLALSLGAPRMRARRRRELASVGKLREVPDHPMLELLATPNPEMSGRLAIYITQVWLDMKGEAFWMLSLDKDGKPTAFYPIPPHWVQQTPTPGAKYFMVSAGGAQLRVYPEAMIWFRDPDPENPYSRGTGVAESLGDEAETDEYASKYLKNWFFNSAMPSAIVSFEGADAAAVKVMQEKWEREHRGYQNAHRVHFGMGKMNAQRLDASLREQQMLELRAFSRDTMAQVFGVPPEIIGIIENSNRSTIDAAGYIYALGVEFPRAEFLREELQRQLAPKYDASLVIEIEVPIPDDENRRLNVMKAAPTVFSKNEWRGEAGYDPLEEFEGQFPAALPGQKTGDGEQPKDDGETKPKSEKARVLPDDPPWAVTPLLGTTANQS